MTPKVRLRMRSTRKFWNARLGRYGYFYSYEVLDKYGRQMAADGSSDPQALLEQALGDLEIFVRLLKMGHKLKALPAYEELLG